MGKVLFKSISFCGVAITQITDDDAMSDKCQLITRDAISSERERGRGEKVQIFLSRMKLDLVKDRQSIQKLRFKVGVESRTNLL